MALMTLALMNVALQPLAAQSADSSAVDPVARSLPSGPAPGSPEIEVMLARTTEEYPVTPGDRYLLTYYRNSGVVEQGITVPPTKQVDLGLFGTIDARETTYRELETAILERVSSAYADSFPTLELQEVGRFTVLITGEVSSTDLVEAWGLMRLSEAIEGHMTPYSSIRNIRIRRGGESLSFDLFRSERAEDLTQDPLLLAGDQIVVNRLDRKVQINGEVERPGSYELLPGEQLPELIEEYGSGFTKRADPGRIKVQTCPEGLGCTSRTRYVDYTRGGGRIRSTMMTSW